MSIPEELKTAAYAIVDKMKAEDPGFDYGPYEFAIAAAWAERQRCADVADSFTPGGERYEFGNDTATADAIRKAILA